MTEAVDPQYYPTSNAPFMGFTLDLKPELGLDSPVPIYNRFSCSPRLHPINVGLRAFLLCGSVNRFFFCLVESLIYLVLA